MFIFKIIKSASSLNHSLSGLLKYIATNAVLVMQSDVTIQ